MSEESKKSIMGVLVVVAHAVDCPAARGGSPKTTTSGPAQVATDAYRSGWDGIFGASVARGEA